MEVKQRKKRAVRKNQLFKLIEYKTKLTKKEVAEFVGFTPTYYNKVAANPKKYLKAEQFINLFFLAKVDFYQGINYLFPLQSFNDKARAQWFEENPSKGSSRNYILTPREELKKQSALLEEIQKLTALVYRLKTGKRAVNVPKDFNPFYS